MSRRGAKKEALGFGKVRVLLWLIILGGACGLFVRELYVSDDGWDSRWHLYYPPKQEKGFDSGLHSNEDSYLFIYSKKDTKDKRNIKEKLEYQNLSKEDKENVSYAVYDVENEFKGIKYRNDKKKGEAICYGIVVPLLLILLTVLFEKPIVRKLENLNS